MLIILIDEEIYKKQRFTKSLFCFSSSNALSVFENGSNTTQSWLEANYCIPKLFVLSFIN
jgi:hypothetical protein